MAGTDRPELATAYPAYGTNHGYDFWLQNVTRGPHTFCAYGINVGAGSVNTQLGCQTVQQGGPPATPTLVVSAPTLSTPALRVDVRTATNDATQVLIQRAPPSFLPWTYVRWGASANWGAVFDDTGLNPGETYCYLATVINSYGNSQAGPTCATTQLAAFPRPTDIRVTDSSPNHLVITWTDNAAGESGYWIRRRGAADINVNGTPGTGEMSWRADNLTPNTEYCFTIGAEANNHAYDPAPPFCATTPNTPPPMPTGVSSLRLWNCDSHARHASVWMISAATQRWVRQGDILNGWTQNGCGPAITRPGFVVTPPDQTWVTVAVVIQDGQYCRDDDPTQPSCRTFEATFLGDRKGYVVDRLAGS